METSEIKYLKEHQRKSWAARSGISRQTLERHEKQNEELIKKLDKKKAAIAKLTKKLLPSAKKAERDRIGKIRGK